VTGEKRNTGNESGIGQRQKLARTLVCLVWIGNTKDCVGYSQTRASARPGFLGGEKKSNAGLRGRLFGDRDRARLAVPAASCGAKHLTRSSHAAVPGIAVNCNYSPDKSPVCAHT